MKNAMILGAGGFIGHHLTSRLKQEGFWVRGVDLVAPAFERSAADEFIIGDLGDRNFTKSLSDQHFSEVYQLAADMGGAGYIFTGDHDAALMSNSAQININIASQFSSASVGRLFFASSACVYPIGNQTDPNSPNCEESTAYPANPDSNYGWEKLFSERLFLAQARNNGLNVAIGRYHNVFGTLSAWHGGREKAPSAICRKVAEASAGGEIELWGDGSQTRSFLFIEECLEGTCRLIRSSCGKPINIGSEQMIGIQSLAELIIEISGKSLTIRNVDGPVGVMGRNSDNRLIRDTLGWEPTADLRLGLEKTYAWIEGQVRAQKKTLASPVAAAC